MRKAVMIYNPKSGVHEVKDRLSEIIEYFLQKDVIVLPIPVFVEATYIIQIVKSMEFDMVIASGGDGTVSYVANLLLENNISVPLGIIPSGTCNDFARSISIPQSVGEALEVIIKGKLRSIDVGRINGERYFLGTLAGGNFINASYNTHNELKKNFGPLAYYLKALTEITNINCFDITLVTDTKEIKESVFLFVILNGKHAGGFTNVINDADVSDGMMDIMLIRGCSHIDLAGIFFKLLTSDTVIDPNVVKIRAEKCRIECDRDIPISIDGEEIKGFPVNVEFINKALNVIL